MHAVDRSAPCRSGVLTRNLMIYAIMPSFYTRRLHTTYLQGSPTYGYITSTPKPGWNMVDVVGYLSDGSVPCKFDTDVNAPALAEFMVGGCFNLCVFYNGGVGTVLGATVLKRAASARTRTFNPDVRVPGSLLVQRRYTPGSLVVSDGTPPRSVEQPK